VRHSVTFTLKWMAENKRKKKWWQRGLYLDFSIEIFSDVETVPECLCGKKSNKQRELFWDQNKI